MEILFYVAAVACHFLSACLQDRFLTCNKQHVSWIWCVSVNWTKTCPAPSLDIVSKNLILTAVH